MTPSNVLLPTKLFVPLLEPDVLTRMRLLRLLDDGRSADLILVSAPAGAGKTTLVADWLRHAHVPTGWLSLDASDDDPSMFLAGLAEAYDALAPGVADHVRAMLAASQPPEPAAIARTLIADVTSAQVEGVVVLDDYHVLSDPLIHQQLALLLERTPSSPTLVLISRSDPPLPLARLRARRRLCEIRQADLQFLPTESDTFIRRFSGRHLRSEAVEALTQRTEGWAAGLQLAALALRQAPDPEAFVAGFQGTHTFVADYLTDEVLSHLPESWQRFVLRSALLDRVCGPLCDAALQTSGSQALLEELSRANLFIVPLDAERRWFRYHHLFADLLRRRYTEEVQETQALLGRAAAWCAASGAVGDAVNYASRAGNTALAADLVAQHGLQALAAGEAYRALRWVHLLPENVVRDSPDLCIIAAWAYSQQERYAPSAEYARRVADLTPDAERPHPHVEGPQRHARLVIAGTEALEGRSTEEALGQIRNVLAEAPEHDLPVRASGEIMQGKLLAFTGRYEAAVEAHARARDLGVQAGSDLLRLAGITGLAETYLYQGRLQAAIDTITSEMEGRRRSLREVLGSQVANLFSILAMAYLERGQYGEAKEALAHGRQALGHDEDAAEWPPSALLTQVRQTAFHSSSAIAHYGLAVHVRLLLQEAAYATPTACSIASSSSCAIRLARLCRRS